MNGKIIDHLHLLIMLTQRKSKFQHIFMKRHSITMWYERRISHRDWDWGTFLDDDNISEKTAKSLRKTALGGNEGKRFF